MPPVNHQTMSPHLMQIFVTRLQSNALTTDQIVSTIETYNINIKELPDFPRKNEVLEILGRETLPPPPPPSDRDEILKKIKENPTSFSKSDIDKHIASGTITKDDLIKEGVLTEAIWRKLSNISNLSLPNMDEVIKLCNKESSKSDADVYLFGVPGCGKTCVLAGLTKVLNYNTLVGGGSYSGALRQYVDNGITPPPTRLNYLTTINADFKGEKRDRNINVVEMAGEEFVSKIAYNPKNEFQIKDIGTGASELLSNDNPKIFFMVIDPAANERNITIDKKIDENRYTSISLPIHQSDCFERLFDIFLLPENENIMKKVKAVYFIFSKIDKLGNEEEKVNDVIKSQMSNQYKNVKQKYFKLLRRYSNIDQSHKIIKFSLGKFYVGNVFDYNEQDSSKILEVIDKIL